MALREIRLIGDEILETRAKEVKKISDKIKVLVDDMIETMYATDGVGIAAPQVGMLKRIFIVDVSETGDQPTVFINPVIEETKGEEWGYEGCLSVPGKQGKVLRPTWVRVRALDINGEEFVLEVEDFYARAICHENDHIDGILYVTKAKDIIEV